MSETKEPYITSESPIDIGAMTSPYWMVRIRKKHFLAVKALAVAHNIPVSHLLTLLITIGLQHVTPEQINQAREFRLRLRERG